MILQFLKHGKSLCKTPFPNFVETWNWVVNFCANLCGDSQNGGNGKIKIDRTNPNFPVVRLLENKQVNKNDGLSSIIGDADGSTAVTGDVSIKGHEKTNFSFKSDENDNSITLDVKDRDEHEEIKLRKVFNQESEEIAKVIGTSDFTVGGGGSDGVKSLNNMKGDLRLNAEVASGMTFKNQNNQIWLDVNGRSSSESFGIKNVYKKGTSEIISRFLGTFDFYIPESSSGITGNLKVLTNISFELSESYGLRIKKEFAEIEFTNGLYTGYELSTIYQSVGEMKEMISNVNYSLIDHKLTCKKRKVYGWFKDEQQFDVFQATPHSEEHTS